MKSDIFHSQSQPPEGLRPTTDSSGSFASKVMKKFIVRFWFTSIIIVVLTMEFVWIDVIILGNGTGKSSLVTQFLFPVLFVVGLISHFHSRFRNK